ncbi:MAG: hypothetical protein A3D39_02575 [Candidatus Buchananbacteria bacterium RIFCSPHIGHO2_02_FULL_39_17]|uniref:Phosphofructokinase domain-containing protein n=1 Tax=Candidatus Buchananbacteria bacterium RIFCSPLOWO2_01_FULL_40_23b TaxID=1797544 RepID=A0A1G1YSF1_9BACT|nr:MAG: hypothetical protein A3D39_02575 [Candidatus Buchananbacteria bacterium RIFCSPHIGHO2_02_FULL_39_17]OGY55288.1 MAG: hypothetical protein A2912_02510 [Candidatus Buchananbacteria bacterium RIFCSPLOWO2_01_FULL_40_23b]
MLENVGILTGGGPAAGLNAVIYGATKAAHEAGYGVIGIRHGWRGILDGQIMEITPARISGIANKPGTILGTSRTNLTRVKIGKGSKTEDKTQEVPVFMKTHKLCGLIAIGGEDTISVAEILYNQFDLPVVCAPKTIDGDVCGTDRTFGLDTAANWVANAIRGIHEDFASTGYIACVEVMGRKAGWLTLYGGLAGGSHVILIPEKTYVMSEIADQVKKVVDRYGYCILTIAEELKIPALISKIQEGAGPDSFNHAQIALREKGWAKVLAEQLQKSTGVEARPIVLGHAQRGGPPSVLDVIMGLQIGRKAFELIHNGEIGQLVAWVSENPVPVDLKIAGGGKFKPIPPEIYEPLLANLDL